jgi:hypothetical protein
MQPEAKQQVSRNPLGVEYAIIVEMTFTTIVGLGNSAVKKAKNRRKQVPGSKSTSSL